MTGGTTCGSKNTVLIAEDEDVIRNGMAKYMQLHTDRFENIYQHPMDGSEVI